jgi:hypothetical protein
VTLGIIIPLVALPVALVVAWRWYSRSVRDRSDHGQPQVSGVRLTSEALHRLPSPPWRVVHEIGDQLPDVDHVVIGPAGIIAVQTRLGDRPAPTAPPTEPPTVGQRNPAVAAALVRAPLDELLVPVSMRTALLARVHWGVADIGQPPATSSVDGLADVEGQRLGTWLAELATTTPAPVEGARVDAAWRVVTMGIGRPDPLAGLG